MVLIGWGKYCNVLKLTSITNYALKCLTILAPSYCSLSFIFSNYVFTTLNDLSARINSVYTNLN